MKRTYNIILILFIAVVTGLVSVPAGAYTLDDLMRESVQNRDTIKIFKGNIDKSESSITIARSFFIPDLEALYAGARDLEDSDQEEGAFSVTSSVNLFAGFRDYHNLKAEKTSKEISELWLKGAKQDLQLETAAGFTEVFRSIENLKVAKSSLKLFQERYENVKLKFETGLSTRREMLEVKVEADNAEQLTQKTEANVLKSLNELSRITGIAGLKEDILDFSVLKTLPERKPYEELEKLLLANRSELTIQKKNKDVYSRRYEAKKSEYYPSVNLAASYSKEDAKLDPWDAEEDWKASLAVSVNLFDGLKTTAGLKSRKQDIANANYQLLELEKRLKTQLTNILLDFDVAEKNLKVADSGVAEAEENVRTTELAFSQGRATTTDVLNSIYSLARAQLNVINARTDLILTDFRLKRMVEEFQY